MKPDNVEAVGGPWTTHGHEIAGVTVAGSGRPPVARCGGPGLCRKCSLEAVQMRNSPWVSLPNGPLQEHVDHKIRVRCEIGGVTSEGQIGKATIDGIFTEHGFRIGRGSIDEKWYGWREDLDSIKDEFETAEADVLDSMLDNGMAQADAELAASIVHAYLRSNNWKKENNK